MKRISIDPVTRLEGHGKIDIFLDDQGEVANAYLQIPELRGFEKFCVGRPAEEMPNLTARICGVCPEAHHMAATKALDGVFHVDPPPAAKKLRELFYSIFYATDHTTHFYALGGPDFRRWPRRPAGRAEHLGRGGKKVGMDIAGKVLKMRRDGHHLIKTIGGRAVHPNWGLPGGVSKGINEEQRKRDRGTWPSRHRVRQVLAHLVRATWCSRIQRVPGAHQAAGIFITISTYNMGTVDANNKVELLRRQDPHRRPRRQREFAKYDAARTIRDHIVERVEPWTYLKFPYLKNVGWKGFVDGAGVGRVQGHAAVAFATPPTA